MAEAAIAIRSGEELEQHRGLIAGYLRRHVRDHHVTEDLVQETLLRGYRSWRYLRRHDAVESWLLRIAYHVAMDWHRKGARSPSTRSHTEGVELHEQVGEEADDPQEDSQTKQVWRSSMLRALTHLAERDRILVIAHYYVGFSCRQLAQRTGLSVANVKVRLYRARRAMRRHLPSEDEFREWATARDRRSDRAYPGPPRPVGRRRMPGFSGHHS